MSANIPTEDQLKQWLQRGGVEVGTIQSTPWWCVHCSKPFKTRDELLEHQKGCKTTNHAAKGLYKMKPRRQ